MLIGICSCNSTMEQNQEQKAVELVQTSEDSLSTNYNKGNEIEYLTAEEVSPIDYIGSDNSVPSSTKGNLVYYCPDKMLENTCNNVSVCISTAEAKRAVINLAHRVRQSSGGDESEIMSDISQSSIEIYPKMKVELKYDDDDFVTIYQPENPDLIFDGKSDMNWDWIIKPQRVGNTQLSLIVSAYDKKHDQWVSVDIPPKIFNISVQVDPRSYLSKLWGFLENNPEWIFAQVIFPVVGFYAGRRRRKKNVNNAQ